MTPLLIFGAGGHGACVFAAASESGLETAAILDDSPQSPVLGKQVLSAASFRWPTSFEFVVAIGDCRDRKRKFLELIERGGTPITIIHPRSYVSQFSKIGAGSVVFPGAVTGPRSTIGDNVILNNCANVGHDCLIESHAHIAPLVSLCGASHIGEGAWIGSGTSVIQHRRVGEWALIGAGSVIVRDIPARHTAYGSPAHHNCLPIKTELRSDR